MGLSSLGGIQMWGRFCLFFMQPCKYPETPYTKYMKKSRIHLYTIMQMGFWGLIFFVQNYKPIAIGFPFMTLLCIPGRLYLFARVFEGWELLLLDGDDLDIDRWIQLKEDNNEIVSDIPVSTRMEGSKRMMERDEEEADFSV